VIGYYVHHHGRGHLHRARSIAAHCAEPVTVLSSLPRPGDWVGDWVQLPRDDDGAIHDPTAHGALHWAPLGHTGLRERMSLIAAWIRDAVPSVLMVDVSVEVTALARLLGVPTVVAGMPGHRDDPPHRLGYTLAGTVLAPWPDGFTETGPFAGKTVHVGAFSRFDGLVPPPASGRTVLVLSGAGGTDLTIDDIESAAAATPGWTWRSLGVPGGPSTSDVWPALCEAAVVVTHAGQNAVAETAAARRPAVIIPQRRPFGEQHCTARVLAGAGLAVTAPGWPTGAQWPWLLAAAERLGGQGWRRWAPGDGARRAAQVLACASR
jgi:hypothetical protein